MKYWLYIFLIILWPSVSSASVTISEIAWMGDSESANNEWIELHNNDSSEVDISGWILSDTGTLNIELSGVLPADSYSVLERNRASGNYLSNPPFLIYTGALVNTGTTLVLTRADGSVADQVSGGVDWSIGGDNAAKYTVQYSDTGGWVTAAPTPGRQNAGTSAPVPESDNTAVITKSSTAGGSTSVAKKIETVKFVLPPSSLQLNLDIQNTGYVNQTIPFAVKASGIGDTLLSSLKYEWNFGDLSTSTLKNPRHVYSYPGTYVVTLKAFFAKQEQIVRQSITVLPVQVSLTRNSQGDVQINNDSPYEIDLSGYTLAGDTKIAFPLRTILLSKNTITVPMNRVASGRDKAVALYDAQAVLVTATWITKPSLAVPTNLIAVSAPRKVTMVDTTPVVTEAVADKDFTFLSNQTETDFLADISTDTVAAISTDINQSVISIPAQGQSRSVFSDGHSFDKSYVGLVLILVLAVGGVVLLKRNDSHR